jgi:hypothetical protein
MIAAHPIASCEPILDTMIQLAFARQSQRVIAAGSAAFDIYRGLYRRGFSRVTTAAHCRVRRIQHDVALIAGQESVQALEALLIRIMPLLNRQATVAVWIDSIERRRGRSIQLLLERLGFRVESGAKCEIGFVLAARRHERNQLANVA